MKKPILISAFLLFALINLSAQSVTLDFYIGTWKYENTDTGDEFIIKLRKTQYEIPNVFGGGTEDCLVGVYSLKKNNQLIQNNFEKFHETLNPNSYPILILDGLNGNHTELLLSVKDYTLTNSRGEYKFLSPCHIYFKTLSPKTINWVIKITEQELLFTAPEDRFPTGTNLPTNLILTKVE